LRAKHIFLAFSLFLMLLGALIAGTVRAQQQSAPGVATGALGDVAGSPLPVNANAAVTDAGPNAMTRAVVQRGVLTCAARVEQVTRFLGFGAQAGAHFMPPPQPADQRLFSLQMELPAGAAGNSFVDMSFAPHQANGCGATYQSVSFWPQSCEALAQLQFANVTKGQALQRDVMVLNLGPMTKVFLMPAGNAGCISIKKEIVL
jgi:hypothetical protein